MQYLIDVLNGSEHHIKHLGYSALINLFFEHESGGNVKTITIRQHHGFGGAARTEGGDVTKYARSAKNWDIDIQLFGHVHHKDYRLLPPLLSYTANGIFTQKRRIMAITGSFLKTFNEDKYPSYGEEKDYPPIDIGAINIGIELRRNDYRITYEG